MNPKFLLKELCICGKPLKLMHSIEGIEVDMENLSKDNTGLKIYPNDIVFVSIFFFDLE